MKYSDLLDEATTKLLPSRISNCALSHAIREGFPDSVSKKVGEKRQTYIYGLEKNTVSFFDQSSLEIALRRNDELE